MFLQKLILLLTINNLGFVPRVLKYNNWIKVVEPGEKRNFYLTEEYMPYATYMSRYAWCMFQRHTTMVMWANFTFANMFTNKLNRFLCHSTSYPRRVNTTYHTLFIYTKYGKQTNPLRCTIYANTHMDIIDVLLFILCRYTAS